MGDAIGNMLPSAVGVAISPLPIVAVVLMLVTSRAGTNGPAFVGGWMLGVVVVGGLVLLLAGGAGVQDEGEPATWVGWLELILGLLLLLLALGQWRKRPAAGEEAETPGWMHALDSFTPLKAAGIAAFLAGINPKNLLLIIAGAAAIAQAGIAAGEQAVALLVFVLIASVGVAGPVVLYFVLGERSRKILDGLKDWMSRNNAAIMAVLFVIFGAKLLGQGIAALS